MKSHQKLAAAAAKKGKDCLAMQTNVSTKGQVVLPGPLRRRLGIRAGDPLEANIEAGRNLNSDLRLPAIIVLFRDHGASKPTSVTQ